MAKINAKDMGMTLLLGSGVVVLTPFLAGFVSSIDMLAFEIIPNVLSIGTALAAGVSAFAVQMGIDKFLK